MKERERERERESSYTSKFIPSCVCVYPCPGQSGQRVRPTPDELIDPNGPYMKRRVDVTSDPVGYGFVIRGSRPVYVHTVDPSGPAAAAGLQVGGVKPKDTPPLYKHCTCTCTCLIFIACVMMCEYICWYDDLYRSSLCVLC